jgi:flagellar basal body-associated protein FliL
VATHSSWWIILVLGVIILVLALVTTTRWALDTASRTAERFREDAPAPPAAGRAGPRAGERPTTVPAA